MVIMSDLLHCFSVVAEGEIANIFNITHTLYVCFNALCWLMLVKGEWIHTLYIVYTMTHLYFRVYEFRIYLNYEK